jgi:predicted transcriptional regulator
MTKGAVALHTALEQLVRNHVEDRKEARIFIIDDGRREGLAIAAAGEAVEEVELHVELVFARRLLHVFEELRA